MAYRTGTSRSTGSRKGSLPMPKHHDGPGVRPLYVIADEIFRDWRPDPVTRKGGVNYAALPYLRAMQSLTDGFHTYGADSAVSVVLYFLSNAQSWRGETARRVKAELKSIVCDAGDSFRAEKGGR